jgi:hypothetical protein
MLASLTFDVLAILAGLLGMLWLLLLRFGAAPVSPMLPFDGGLTLEGYESENAVEAEESFISMPSHITTHAEMVAWLTEELPKLTEEAATRPHRL